jgi:hypothetical protein
MVFVSGGAGRRLRLVGHPGRVPDGARVHGAGQRDQRLAHLYAAHGAGRQQHLPGGRRRRLHERKTTTGRLIPQRHRLGATQARVRQGMCHRTRSSLRTIGHVSNSDQLKIRDELCAYVSLEQLTD